MGGIEPPSNMTLAKALRA